MSCPARPAVEPRGDCADCGKDYRIEDMERFVGGAHVCWDCLEIRLAERDGPLEWKDEELDLPDSVFEEDD